MIAEAVEKGLFEIVERVMKAYQTRMKQYIRERGLVDTGDGLNSVTYRVLFTPGGVRGQILINSYMTTWETGISVLDIPSYLRQNPTIVRDLEKYFLRKGADDALRAAYLTIDTWEREGAPTRNSRRFSRAPGGERTRFILRTVEDSEKSIQKFIQEEGRGVLVAAIRQPIRDLLTII